MNDAEGVAVTAEAGEHLALRAMIAGAASLLAIGIDSEAGRVYLRRLAALTALGAAPRLRFSVT